MKICEVTADTELTVEYSYDYEDEYGSHRSSTSTKQVMAPSKAWGYYVVDDSGHRKDFKRLTPAFKLVSGYQFCVPFKDCKNAPVIGAIGLGSLQVDIEYDKDVLHISELKFLDKFVFLPDQMIYVRVGDNGQWKKTPTVNQVYIGGERHGWEYANMKGK